MRGQPTRPLSATEATWKADAACRGMDPEMFFPARGESPSQAKAVCRVCPVRDECEDFALRNCERWGIWGGLSERERKRIRRRRAA